MLNEFPLISFYLFLYLVLAVYQNNSLLPKITYKNNFFSKKVPETSSQKNDTSYCSIAKFTSFLLVVIVIQSPCLE